MYNQNLFNQNYINEAQYNELLKLRNQIDQQIKFEIDQQNEINKMLKALNDYFDAAQKIAPQYQGQAVALSAIEIYRRLNNN